MIIYKKNLAVISYSNFKKKTKYIVCFKDSLIVIKIKEKKKVSVQEQCLLLLRILPKFWSRFQLIGLKSTQRHKCFNGARCLWYCSMKKTNYI
jgi:hypothetical protein